MKLAQNLLIRFGFLTQKADGPDAFDLRLQRIHTRERRRQVHAHLFRSILPPMVGEAQS
jgi:hypothetical protein